MQIIRGLRIVAACAVFFLAGCDDDSDNDPPFTPLPPLQDAASPVATADGGTDSGMDATAAADTGTAQDGAAPTDTGTSTGPDSSTQDASSNLDASSDSATATDAANDTGLLASSTGPWVVYMDPYGDGGANPAMGIQGSAMAARTDDAGMRLTLNVSGLPAARGFGSHLHKLACVDMKAGGHFQHDPASAVDASANDPAFANPSNEVWLDFTTDDAGVATASATVGWIPGDGGAQAIVVHDRLTEDGGVAGAKLACLPFQL